MTGRLRRPSYDRSLWALLQPDHAPRTVNAVPRQPERFTMFGKQRGVGR